MGVSSWGDQDHHQGGGGGLAPSGTKNDGGLMDMFSSISGRGECHPFQGTSNHQQHYIHSLGSNDQHQSSNTFSNTAECQILDAFPNPSDPQGYHKSKETDEYLIKRV